MRLLSVVVFAVIAEFTVATQYTIVPITPIHLQTQVGAKHDVIIERHMFSHPVECFLEVLNGTEVLIDDNFEYPGFERFTSSNADCGLSIVINKDLVGNWTLLGRSVIFTTPTERRLPFSIDIEGETESEEKYVPDESSEEDNIVWFTQINRVTRTGQYIDITLNKLDVDERCYFITPDGRDSSHESHINGVTVHDSSDFVSCRITVGPMEASLLGVWTLCGMVIGDEEKERCQRVSMSWNDNSDTSIGWQTNEETLFNHSVSLNQYLQPVVVGSGTTLNCHVITPNGEDLVLTPDMEYPMIKRRDTASTTCAVSIGPIEMSMMGAWTLYGQFRSSVWFYEVRLPMTLNLYDEDNPFVQPYNVTNLAPFNRVINLNTLLTEEMTGSGNKDSCEYRAPNGELYNFSDAGQFPGVTIVDVGSTVVCRMSIGPLNQNMLGEWEIIGKFSNNGIFTERRQVFNIIQEDPENPIIEDRGIENLAQQVLDTKIGARENITITRGIFINPQSCLIRTPNGRQYTIMDGFNVAGVTFFNGTDVECGVTIDVLSEDMVGEWVLIARATRSLDAIERRLSFVIYVEERVEATPQEVIIAEGNDLHVRLKNPTEQHETCKLIAPKEDGSRDHEIDTIHNESCGFVVEAVGTSDGGTWEIVYGTRIVYRATVNVTVVARDVSHVDALTFIKDREINKELGPEDAMYCQLIDPRGQTVFEDFGRCKLAIERVTMEHNGYWKMFVGSPGRVLALKHEFLVTVKEAESQAIVSTKVSMERPSLVLSCSVPVTDNVRACKFRDPSGNILLANEGVGEDRFIVHGFEVSVESEVRNHECGLRVTDPTLEDLGLWRCGIETESGTHYGFLSVLCPWLLQDPEILAIVDAEPSLRADKSHISVLEGESVTMSCSIQSAIRYCYFRSWNGTVFSVSPTTSSTSMKYVGSGFDAGECGVRFNDRTTRDTGMWSCHVGLFNDTEEHRARFDLEVREPIVVYHYIDHRQGLVVQGNVNGERQLDYCRFVRIDGTGFTTDSIPPGYKFIGSLESGHCLLQILNNMQGFDILDLHPWTIGAKVRGQDVELTRQTVDNLLAFERPPSGSSGLYLWVIIILIGLTLLMIGVAMGPKKNREWTYQRASQLRNSIRSSYRKPRQLEHA